MNLQSTTGIDHAGVKISSAWATVLIAKMGFDSWTDLAALLAALYSLCLLCEWFWKKFWRPLLERMGWIAPRTNRRQTDE